MLSRGEKMETQCFFFSYKKASKGPQVSTEYLKVNFGQRFGLCQENSCTHETLDYQYEWQKTITREKKNLCLWHCLKPKKMRGLQVNIMNVLLQMFLVSLLLFL
jgi:hypothetical protein